MDVSVRRLDIQGLRAIAVIVVVAFHAGLPVPGGFVGVDVFFVISGFVITGMLRSEWVRNGRVQLRSFYLRRFMRLFPALALMITVTTIATAFISSPIETQENVAYTGIGAMFVTANLIIAKKTGGYFDQDAHANPLLHTWSLSVEEQFYLVLPFLVASGWFIAKRHPRVGYVPFLIAVLITAISMVLAFYGIGLLMSSDWGTSLVLGPYGRWLESLVGFYSPVTRSWEFSSGVILALVSGKLRLLPRCCGLFFGLTGGALLVASLWVISGSLQYPSVWTMLPVLGTLLLIAAGSAGENAISRTLTMRPLVRFGDWSYSIYLWHWPFIVFAASLWPRHSWVLIIAAIISLAPAVASYFWLETPIRNRKSLSACADFKIFVLTVLPPLAACAALLFVSDRSYWSSGVQAMRSAYLPHVTSHCVHGATKVGGTSPCVFNSGAKGSPIYLVGDSTALHFSEAAVGAGELLGRPVKIETVPRCQFKDVFSGANGLGPVYSADACRKRYENSMRWLTTEQPGVVIISSLNFQYQDGQLPFGLAPDNLTSDPRERIQVLNRGLASTIEQLQRAGHQVIVVQAAPVFRGDAEFDPLKCTWRELDQGKCSARMSRADADEIQAIQRAELLQVAGETGSVLWDPREFFCPADECSTELSGVNLYRDAIHISPSASRMLAPSLAEAIQRTNH